MAKLLISLPSGDISKELSGDVVTIGRTADKKIQIDHHSVSAHHARLILATNGSYKLKDLDSTNRSCVNGIPVNDAELNGSCFLRFGTIECVFKADTSNSNDQLHSQVDELQRQLDALMKARDVISHQNQELRKECDAAKLARDNAVEDLNEAQKHIEESAKSGNAQEISAKLVEAKKQLEAVGKERDTLLLANKDLTQKLDAATEKLNQFQHKSGQVPVSVQQKAAAHVRAELDEDADYEEEELAEAGQRTAVATATAAATTATAPRMITGAPSWLNRGDKRKAADPQPTNITTMPAPQQKKEKTGGLSTGAMTAVAPAAAPGLRLVSPNGNAAPGLGSPAVKIGRASANAAPQNPEIKPAWELLNAMRRSLHYFLRHQDELKVMQEMSENAHSLTEMARSELLRPIYELAASVEALMADLHANPVNLNASTLRTVGQSIDFLATLIDESNLSRLKDVTTAKIFAIDDDEGILETIKATMEMAHLQIDTSAQSTAGLTHLSQQNYDLILLDVGLPEMNGMDICSRVRAMPHHQKTPIVFLTGEATVQNRVQSTLNGGNDLIGKPFSVLELAVKAITWVFKGQLGLV